MKQLIETVEQLRLRNIGFRSLTDAIDTTTAQGVLVFHTFSALAEFERALIRERTREGLAAARRVGRTGGRPPKLSDDDLDAARTLLANPDITVADRLGVSPATLIPTRRANREQPSPRFRAASKIFAPWAPPLKFNALQGAEYRGRILA